VQAATDWSVSTAAFIYLLGFVRWIFSGRETSLVVNLVKDGPDAAIAACIGRWASEFLSDEANRVEPATDCAGLSAIADGLDRVPKMIGDGIAWCATEIIGVPGFPGKIVGALVSGASCIRCRRTRSRRGYACSARCPAC
jgi:hypothetical protein